jgi:hypothetical protein
MLYDPAVEEAKKKNAKNSEPEKTLNSKAFSRLKSIKQHLFLKKEEKDR